MINLLLQIYFILLPLGFNLQNQDSPFEFFKFIFSGFFICSLGIIYFTQLFLKSHDVLKFSKAFYVLLLIAFANFVSYSFSINSYLSFWGDPLLPSDSLASVLLFVLLAFMIEQAAASQKKLHLGFILAAGAILQIGYGFIQNLGFDFVNWSYEKPLFGSFGSTVSFSTYLGCLLPLLSYYFLQSKSIIQSVILLSFIAIGNYLILQTGSRTPAAASVVVQILFLIYVFKFKTQELIKPLVFLCLTFVVVHLFFIFKPIEKEILKQKLQPAQLSLGFELRQLVWQDALPAWKQNPILGTGPETFAVELRARQGIELNKYEHWQSGWIKAHNQWVHYLINLGLIGVLAHLALLILMLKWGWQLFWALPLDFLNLKAFSYFAGFIFLFLANMTSFNFISTQFLYFMFPVLLAAELKTRHYTLNLTSVQKAFKFCAFAIVLLLFLLVSKFYQHHRADIFYQKSYSEMHQSKNLQQAAGFAAAALEANDQEPAYHCHMAQIYTQRLMQTQTPLELQNKIFSELQAYINNCKDKAINRDHYFFLAANMYAQLYMTDVLPTAQLAIENFELYKNLAPNSPLPYFRLGLLNLKMGQADLFTKYLEKALSLKPDYLPAYLELFQYYYKTQNQLKKQELLNQLSQLKFYNKQFLSLLNELIRLARLNNDAAAQQIFQQKLTEPLIR